MDISERDQYLIDRHLRSTLDASEEQEFNERLKEQVFRQRLNLHRDLLDIMMTDERIATKTLLHGWEKKEVDKKPVVRQLWYKLAIAAAGVLLLIFLFWPKQNLTEDLFTQYYTHFPDALSQITRNSSPVGQTTSLMLAYNQREWKEAVALMKMHLQENPDDHAVRLYYALSQLNLDEVRIAKTELDVVISDSSDQDFQSAARWYRALSLIKLNERKEAIEALKYMIDQDHYQSDYARELLEKVKAN